MLLSLMMLEQLFVASGFVCSILQKAPQDAEDHYAQTAYA